MMGLIGACGNSVLLLAVGETDAPEAAIVASIDDVRRFLIRAVTGEDNADVEEYMSQILGHDFSEDHTWRIDFEIGYVSARCVYRSEF